MKNKVTEIAYGIFNTLLVSSDNNDTPFYALIDINVDGVIKPLLILGLTHPSHEDGRVIAILNPDTDLVSRLSAMCGYDDQIIKEIVSQKCDLMVSFWVDAYKADPVPYVFSYKSRTPSTAKFYAKDGMALK